MPRIEASLRALLFAVLVVSGAHAEAERSLCGNEGFTVGFFNGVWNDKPGAEDGSAALDELVPDTYGDEPVQFETFYNQTEGLLDIVETFAQRANEMEATGALAERLDIFWDLMVEPDAPFWSLLRREVAELDDFKAGFVSALEEATRLALTGLMEVLPTAEDYAEHRLRVDEQVLQGRKLLLVAHSQGNLFLNAAFDHASANVPSNSLRAVHIAPASTTTRGPHVLADIDIVINALRVQGWSTVPESNLVLPLDAKDISGHRLRETYLDESRAGSERIRRELLSSLSELVTPEPRASKGFFTVTLTWQGQGDVDLHVFEPDEGHVYYNYPGGVTGFLDVDNREGVGPEHYYASCYGSFLQVGTYEIGVNNFDAADGEVATVQVASARDGVLATRSLELGPAMGDYGDVYPIPLFFLQVYQDAAGVYRVEIIDRPGA